MPKARISDIDWYDNQYYKKPQVRAHQWYVFLLQEYILLAQRNSKILEVGCGESYALEYLYKNGIVSEKNVYGLDQSTAAIAYMKKKISGGKFIAGDIYQLPYKNNMFDVLFMMEVIEHVEDPIAALKEVYRVAKPGAYFFLSFPNFTVLPWKIARMISDRFRLPELINKQPIDNIYSIPEVVSFATLAGFTLQKMTGVTYLTAGMDKIESFHKYAITRHCNNFGLAKYSLHPLFMFRKE
jgi:2-polyprenyl-3-methyl-5-hydroxy-6-metoxy-1,4-benzoquinol methylase